MDLFSVTHKLKNDKIHANSVYMYVHGMKYQLLGYMIISSNFTYFWSCKTFVQIIFVKYNNICTFQERLSNGIKLNWEDFFCTDLEQYSSVLRTLKKLRQGVGSRHHLRWEIQNSENSPLWRPQDSKSFYAPWSIGNV